MKYSSLFFLAIFSSFFTACGQSEYSEYYGNESNYNNYNNQQYMQPASYNNGQMNNGDTKVFALKDPNTGMVGAYIPLPSNWQITATGFKGPNGIECEDRAGGSSVRDGQLFQSSDQVIRNVVKPQFQQAGIQITNIIELNEIARNDYQNNSRYWEFAPSQHQYEAKGIEFKDPNGKPGIVVLHFRYSTSQFGNMSFYYYSGLVANPSAYTKAKQAFIYGLANLKISDEAVLAFNQSEQQKAGMRMTAHQKRMNENQKHFDAMNRIHNESTNAINGMIADTWRQKDAASDRMNERAVDMIREENNVTNPWTGGQVKVNGNYQYYFINSNGQYFGTNNANYNPANDPNMNHMTWKKMNSRGY